MVGIQKGDWDRKRAFHLDTFQTINNKEGKPLLMINEQTNHSFVFLLKNKKT
ncbi:hypothetical protein CCAND93_510007 [Capnocytophaga canis]|uniref:Uncharacterized protein n=1 Tax=Capnocytophaga canis TaxID=1848903 RepID=A0A0B7IP49_9FLAO|nr:hypothetical protein CCAND93_510007 [Capnocytophaga canis]